MKSICIALGVGFLLLTACSHEHVNIVRIEDPGLPDVRTLQPVRTIPLELHKAVKSHGGVPGLIAFDLSQDGRRLLTILRAREHDGESVRSVQWLELYDVDSGAMIHQENPEKSAEITLTAGGFLDSGRYYVTSLRTETQPSPAPHSGYTEIFTADPHRKLEHLPVSGVTRGRGDYLFTPSMSSVVSWKTGEAYPTQFDSRLGIQQMTDEGSVLSTNMTGSITFHNSVIGDLLSWNSGFDAPWLLLTTNNYVIAQDDNFRCKVWKLPEIELVAQCPSSSRSKAQKRAIAGHPNAPIFAVAWDNAVHLFNLDPFKKTQEILIPDAVLGLSFTDDRLIIESREGLHIWDIENAALIAKVEVQIPDWNRLRVSKSGVMALLLDNDPNNPKADARSAWIYRIP